MILCVGLSPAVQRTLQFDEFVLGQVNRARDGQVTASGKAVNVARVLRLLGSHPLLVQALGGDGGRLVTRALETLDIEHASVVLPDSAPTRTCVTLLTDGLPPTELVEEAPPLSLDAVAAVTTAVRERLPHARALCLSGSLPRGVPPGFYADLIQTANELGLVTVVDAQKAPLRASLEAKPFLVKPNLEEALATLERAPTGDEAADLRAAVQGLRDAGAVWSLVSVGRRGSLLGGPDGLWRLTSPPVNAVNAIGSGDALTAGLLHAHVDQGRGIPDAAAFGTACGAANCLTPTSGVIRPTDLPALLAEVRVASVSA